MEEQENIRKGLSPELIRFISPEGYREREERRQRMRKIREEAERSLEETGELIEQMKRECYPFSASSRRR